MPQWDLDQVLKALREAPFGPIESVELRWILLKTSLLLAVCSAKRVGELHMLYLSTRNVVGFFFAGGYRCHSAAKLSQIPSKSFL